MSDTPIPAAPFETIDALYRAYAGAEPVPGLVMGVVRDGALAHSLALGSADLATGRPVTTRTRFRIASLTKSFTALTVLALRDEGRIGLETPASAYIPELADLRLPTRDSPPIRVRDLIAHTAGFVTDNAWADRRLARARPDWLDDLRGGWPMAAAPGVAFDYANLGYALLGEIIRRVTGAPYDDAVRRLILDPLWMADTTFDPSADAPEGQATGYRREGGGWSPEPPDADGAFAAIGGLWTTAEDFARYCAFLLAAWPPRDAPDAGPVRRATVRELAQGFGPPALRSTSLGLAADAYGGGLMHRIEPRLGARLQHTGGLPGFGAHVVLKPDRGLAVFGFTNRRYAQPLKANEAALEILLAAFPSDETTPSGPLKRCAEALVAAYDAGAFAPLRPLCADNVLSDRSEASREAEIASLRDRFGARASVKIRPRNALAADVALTCERGVLDVVLILAPTFEPAIQELEFAGAGS